MSQSGPNEEGDDMNTGCLNVWQWFEDPEFQEFLSSADAPFDLHDPSNLVARAQSLPHEPSVPDTVSSISTTSQTFGAQAQSTWGELQGSLSTLREMNNTNPPSSYHDAAVSHTFQGVNLLNMNAPKTAEMNNCQQYENSQRTDFNTINAVNGPATATAQVSPQVSLQAQTASLGMMGDITYSPFRLQDAIGAGQDSIVTQSANPCVLTTSSSKCSANQCEVCNKVMLNPKSLSRHLREHRLDSQKFFCRYPKCKRASVGQGFKRKETRDRHIRSCKSAPHRNGSESPSSITRVSKAGYASASLARGVYRRKDDLLQRAESFSSLDGDLPMNRLAILSEIAELQRWRHDAGPRIIELHALCQTNQVSVPEGSDQVLLEALEELVKLQDFDSQFSRRIQDLNASPFR